MGTRSKYRREGLRVRSAWRLYGHVLSCSDGCVSFKLKKEFVLAAETYSLSLPQSGPNKYHYTLDVPGQLINLADNPSVAVVEIDSIFIYTATVEDKETAEPYILYDVTTILGSMPEGPGHVTRKRFSEFDLLHKLVKSSCVHRLSHFDFLLKTHVSSRVQP